ncbi:LacI family DNA-binding transcriptional regulator [Kribbella sp. NPDC050470]|uniref:LacI family DNA-binding transcriptional regulator n=1 Tax=unclassified Kribbella TaxID=2644121 RepID=UPI0037B38BE8
MAQRRVGIKDVAEAAGVSVTTVSHALNEVEGTRVSEDTRLRIRAVAERLGYTPSRLARGLRLQRSHLLALISDRVATTPYAGRMVLGVQEAAFARGWTVLMFDTGGDPDVEKRAIETTLQHQVDGVLYATMFHREIELPDNLAGLPTVLLDARSRERTVPSVVPDEVGVGRTAVEELLRLGHRRIGFALNRDDIPATTGRLAGYRAALKDAGIRYDGRLVAVDDANAHGGYRATSQLLQLRNRPTAVFCFNDRMAMGAYRAAAELGLRIPDDLSVIGYDDQENIADGLHPELTTVALPHADMGRWAANTLLDLIEERNTPNGPFPVKLPCPIIHRASARQLS